MATTHLESGDCQPADLRVQQLTHTLRLLAAAPEEAVLLAGDLNLRDWEARRAGIGDDGGNKWFDAWHVAGAEKALASTWKDLRFDRILFRRSGALEPISGGFFISEATESDHRGIRSALRLQPTADAQGDSVTGLALPLRRCLLYTSDAADE